MVSLSSKIYFMCMSAFCLHICLCVPYMSMALRGHRRVSDALELVIDGYGPHVGTGNQIQII